MHTSNFLASLGIFGACSNVEPTSPVSQNFEELCKFWDFELAAMLSSFLILRRFKKKGLISQQCLNSSLLREPFIDYELAAMLSSSSSFLSFRGASLFFKIAPEPCQNFARIFFFFSKILSFGV